MSARSTRPAIPSAPGDRPRCHAHLTRPGMHASVRRVGRRRRAEGPLLPTLVRGWGLAARTPDVLTMLAVGSPVDRTPGGTRCAGCRGVTNDQVGGRSGACGGDRRWRTDRVDVGGGVDVGGSRRRRRRAPRQSGPRWLASGRSALAHDRDPRSARGRRAIPVGRPAASLRGVRRNRSGHHRLPHPPQLPACALAARLRAHPGRVGSRNSEFRSFVSARWWASPRTKPGWMSSCPTAPRSVRSTSSGATEVGASSARRPASTSPVGIRRRVSSSPRSRWSTSRRSACDPRVAASGPSTRERVAGRIGSCCSRTG